MVGKSSFGFVSFDWIWKKEGKSISPSISIDSTSGPVVRSQETPGPVSLVILPVYIYAGSL